MYIWVSDYAWVGDRSIYPTLGNITMARTFRWYRKKKLFMHREPRPCWGGEASISPLTPTYCDWRKRNALAQQPSFVARASLYHHHHHQRRRHLPNRDGGTKQWCLIATGKICGFGESTVVIREHVETGINSKMRRNRTYQKSLSLASPGYRSRTRQFLRPWRKHIIYVSMVLRAKT